MQEYYLIYTTSKVYGEDVPCYLTITKGGRILQRNIYDSSKYINLIEATKELNKASKEFTDTEFEIIAIDRRVFGRKPRFVIDG